jgi:anti-sigma B factor antagonist
MVKAVRTGPVGGRSGENAQAEGKEISMAIAKTKPAQPSTETLCIEVLPQDETACTLLVEGRLDLESNEELDRALHDTLDQGWRELYVDLSGVTYLSSLGVTIFIEAMATVEQRGGRIFFTNINPRIKPVLELVGVLAQP